MGKTIPFRSEKDRYIERLILGIHFLSSATVAFMELYERTEAGEKVALENPRDFYAAVDEVGDLITELRAKGYGLLLDRHTDA